MKNFFLKLTLAIILLSASAVGTNAVENNNNLHKLVADRDQVSIICPICEQCNWTCVYVPGSDTEIDYIVCNVCHYERDFDN